MWALKCGRNRHGPDGEELRHAADVALHGAHTHKKGGRRNVGDGAGAGHASEANVQRDQ